MKSAQYRIIVIFILAITPTGLLSLIVGGPAQGSSCFLTSEDDQPASQFRERAAAGKANRHYLYPYNMHLTPGGVSAESLVVKDQFGNVQSGTLMFHGYDNTMINVDSRGYVQALRAEYAGEIGTWVRADFNGELVQNNCIVRVLSQEYDLPFVEIAGEHTLLWYPTTIEGEDIASQVGLYQIPLVDEYAYDLEAEYMGLLPFDSARQIIEVDFAESEENRVCGISGNPFRLGWNIAGNEWQNCFLVPFLPPRSPQWFVMYHEIAHNFTWPSYLFGNGLGPVWHYSEGIASALAMEVMWQMQNDPGRFPMGAAADTSIGVVIAQQRFWFNNDLQNWIDRGADFDSLTASIVDGIWMKYRDSAGVSFAKRFFTPLQPSFRAEMTPLMDSIEFHGNDAAKHTFFVALVSGAFKQDQADVFKNDYHYPLDESLYGFMLQTVTEIMDRAEVLAGDADGSGDIDIADAVYLICYIFLDCSAPPMTAGDSDCDGGITIADVVYLINYIFNDGAEPGANCLK